MTPPPFPRASVIIVGFNSRPHLDRCLRAVVDQTYPGRCEVIFVDNGSGDDSVRHVRETFPSVRVIERRENHGYAGGNNLGAREAGGSILVFLNPDTEVEADWLVELVRPLVMDGSIGLATSKILLSGDSERLNAGGCSISLSGVTTCRRAGQDERALMANEDVSAVSGASFATRRGLFNRLGGFDEAFWMYLEDADLSWRARLLGYRCVVASRSRVKHDYQFTLTPDKLRRIEANRYRMLQKNLSAPAAACLLPALLAGEAMTWGWAIFHGPSFLRAKAGAVADGLRAWTETRDQRRRVQAIRRVPDSEILHEHLPAPEIASIETGWAGRVASAVASPLMTAAGRIGLWLLDVSSRPQAERGASMATPRERHDFGAG